MTLIKSDDTDPDKALDTLADCRSVVLVSKAHTQRGHAMNSTQINRAKQTLEDVFTPNGDAVVVSGDRMSVRGKGLTRSVGIVVCGHQDYNQDVWVPIHKLTAVEDFNTENDHTDEAINGTDDMTWAEV